MKEFIIKFIVPTLLPLVFFWILRLFWKGIIPSAHDKTNVLTAVLITYFFIGIGIQNDIRVQILATISFGVSGLVHNPRGARVATFIGLFLGLHLIIATNYQSLFG